MGKGCYRGELCAMFALRDAACIEAMSWLMDSDVPGMDFDFNSFCLTPASLWSRVPPIRWLCCSGGDMYVSV